MKITVLTLFPDLFPGMLAHSITGRALSAGKWQLEAVDIRDFATDKHRTVDDTPYGGGAGMVMRADIVGKAIEHAKQGNPEAPVVFLTPTGKTLEQGDVNTLATEKGLILLCGHYEGIDQRVIDTMVDVEISIGDYVLTGGEPAALVLADAVVRQLDGVVGNANTLDDESFTHGLLEAPHFTRPEVWENQPVPEVLKSGHHGKIAAWRKAQAEVRTRKQRPDLWQRYEEAAKNEK